MNARHQLIDAVTGEVIVANLEVANTFWQRLRGLQLRRRLAPDEGLLLTPCLSIHTHWMRFAIDVAMLNREGTVLDVLNGVQPWRWVKGRAKTQAMLEVASGRLDRQLIGVRLRVSAGFARNRGEDAGTLES